MNLLFFFKLPLIKVSVRCLENVNSEAQEQCEPHLVSALSASAQQGAEKHRPSSHSFRHLLNVLEMTPGCTTIR